MLYIVTNVTVLRKLITRSTSKCYNYHHVKTMGVGFESTIIAIVEQWPLVCSCKTTVLNWWATPHLSGGPSP